MLVKEDFPLTGSNTFHIKVNAKKFIEVFSVDDLSQALSLFKDKKFLVLGGGSNILLMNDIDSVIKISIPGINIIDEDKEFVYVESGAGVVWNDLVNFTLEKNLGGIENLALIPGTVGAAPIQNIGAYGVELKDSFHSLNAVKINSRQLKKFDKNSCGFGYRTSVFKTVFKNEYIITSIILKLKKNPVPNISYSSVMTIIEKEELEEYTIQDVSRIISDIRKSKLPDPSEIGNAGSFFKNPEVEVKFYEKLKEEYPDISAYKSSADKMKISAGWLIENCGWKGKRKGETGTYYKQALVLVNYGNASGGDILDFAAVIKKSVYDKFGIHLEEEVNIIY